MLVLECDGIAFELVATAAVSSEGSAQGSDILVASPQATLLADFGFFHGGLGTGLPHDTAASFSWAKGLTVFGSDMQGESAVLSWCNLGNNMPSLLPYSVRWKQVHTCSASSRGHLRRPACSKAGISEHRAGAACHRYACVQVSMAKTMHQFTAQTALHASLLASALSPHLYMVCPPLKTLEWCRPHFRLHLIGRHLLLPQRCLLILASHFHLFTHSLNTLNQFLP